MHMRYHTDTSTYPCPKCGKMYPNKQALGSHMRTVHVDRKFSCSLCDKAFKTPKPLRVSK